MERKFIITGDVVDTENRDVYNNVDIREKEKEEKEENEENEEKEEKKEN